MRPMAPGNGAGANTEMMVKKLFLMLVACALLAPPFADARDGRPGIGVQAQGQSMKKSGEQFQHGAREKRGGHDKRDKSKLTEEERRDLHKDLDRANREIYRR